MAWQPSSDFEALGNFTSSMQDEQVDGSGAVIGNSGFTLPSWQLKAKKTFGDGDHSLSFSITETASDEKDVPYDSFMTTGGSFGNVDRQTSQPTATLAYTYNPVGNDMLDLDVILSYADQKIDQEYVAGSSICDPANPNYAPCGFPFPPGGFAVVNADHRYETTKLTFKNTARFEAGTVFHNLRTGVEFKHKKRLDASSAPGGMDERIALFVVDNMSIGERLTLTPALRFETQNIGNRTASYSNDALMGGVSAHYKIGNGFVVFGSLAYTENLPIIDDMTTPAYMTQSEKASTVELGFSYDRLDVVAPGDDLSFKARAYKTKVWDVTSYTSATMEPVTDIEMEGLELETAYSLSSGLYMDLNANIQRGRATAPHRADTGGVSRRINCA